MSLESERHVTQTNPEREQSSRIQRVLPEEMCPRVGDSAEKLKLLAHLIPDHFAQSLERLVRETAANISLSHTLHSDPPQTLTVQFIKQEADRTFDIRLEGDLTQLNVEVPRGIPLIAKFRDKDTTCAAYRKANPQAEEPLAAEGKILQPGDALLVLEKGKKTRWNYTLPKDKFPKGGRVTAIVIPDVPRGFQIKEGDIIGYIEPIE